MLLLRRKKIRLLENLKILISLFYEIVLRGLPFIPFRARYYYFGEITGFGIPSRSKGRNRMLVSITRQRDGCNVVEKHSHTLGERERGQDARHNARNRMGVQRRKGPTTILELMIPSTN